MEISKEIKGAAKRLLQEEYDKIIAEATIQYSLVTGTYRVMDASYTKIGGQTMPVLTLVNLETAKYHAVPLGMLRGAVDANKVLCLNADLDIEVQNRMAERDGVLYSVHRYVVTAVR